MLARYIHGSHTSLKVLESPGFLCKISRPWKVLENGLVLESPGNFSARSWKVLEFSRL